MQVPLDAVVRQLKLMNADQAVEIASLRAAVETVSAELASAQQEIEQLKAGQEK